MMNANLTRWTALTAAAAFAAVVGSSAGTLVFAQATSTTVTPAPVVIAAGSSVLVGVNVSSNLYDNPNSGNVIGQVIAGQTWFAVGRDSTGTWTQIQIDPNNFGWAPASVFGTGNIQLPIVAGITALSASVPSTTATSVPTASAPVVIAAGSSVLVGVNTTTGVYDSPNGNIVGQLYAGQTWFVVGRDTTGKWTQVQIGPSSLGWVLTSALGIGNIQLPTVTGVTGS